MSSITKTTMTSTAAKGASGASGAAGAGRHYSFQPLNIGRILIWGAFALALIVAPLVFTSSLALTMLSQIGYLIIICLSYNILLGQGGMLSFGHAVYTGLGSFIAIHAMNRASSGDWGIPLVLIPVIGGLGGMFFAALLGYVTTKKSGTTFAMITMGIGELVASMALMFPEFFGGEGGITTDRVYGKPFFGLTFGSGMEVYYLIAAYCFVCTAAMFAFTGTPLGRMLNAVRDNPERVEFVGYNTQRVRYFAFIIAGFFAGVGGGLAAINFEIITAMDSVSVMRSGSYLLFTFLGGATFFFGPIIGAVLLVLASVLLSELTKAWLLYLGLVFLLMVMYAPGGVASLIMMNLRVARFGKWRRLAQPYLAIAASALVMIVGGAAIVEMIYHLQLNAALGPQVSFMGVQLDTSSASTWTLAVAVFVVGLGLLEVARRWCLRRWERIQEEIEEAIKRGEG
ncbi:branched-chain amino acid ABC transporter permease [Delftia tsuruhatensis]|uniref:ABC transporter permease n=1 Tax=Delftia tsuruhatensis TaxID=180282 RepID=A0AAX3SFU4_9BURK|nr:MULTISPECIES: branched-chain amino acid ABC transporter permease [Delftia]AOV00257.1 ABC transporter permease [Delftia tsuruhatensis]MCX7506008.1 branched-chain amino acid ABC transporter permease [Delftia tsuruhatensis]MDH0773578.1 branched-chain amino acid ABC transporter permease [Delftia tsuruhatensis]MDH1457492.1 branched-chain amino acid ABC transporter permease [Delftia tsuruhatensis]MDH1823868.1 branched-chain amino acid ABC transporter permease [Delftia tsuruhatensis]